MTIVYLPIIGLEVHVELGTKSKMFCDCSAEHFLVKPNTHTCPVCLGLPGALPVPNQKAIEWCQLIGLALNCEIQDEAKFDRKNYFYPDLPKGYQISQYDQPFCRSGKVGEIRVNRVHLEEDTAKLIHQFGGQEKYTLIDFNRSGVPLVEIVTEPDINSAEEAIKYLKKVQQIVRYLGVSDCDMEKGSMRLEVNISLTSKFSIFNFQFSNYKVEVKNINSFRFVGKAINYEIQRQKEILESGKTPIQETRGFDEKSGRTYSQRTKEEAHDYRYFPEPDIPPFIKLKTQNSNLKSQLPELPDNKIARFIKQYGISEYNAGILAADKTTADYFEETINIIQKSIRRPADKIQNIANIIINKKIDINKYLPAELINALRKKEEITLDEKKVKKVIEGIIRQNPKAATDYKKGKTAVIEFLVGQVMKELEGKGDPITIRKMFERLLNS